jgi:outer membrane receptor protein involved in Fe transport
MAVVAALSSGVCLAQTTGRIEGVVADPAGSPIATVRVEASGASLQGVREAGTGRDGVYRIPALPPGDYVIRARMAGFRTIEKTATVRLDSTASADFRLEPAAAEEVMVSGKAPLIDRTSTSTGTSYTSEVIGRLPVSRNYADVVRANPGVSTDRADTDGRTLNLAIYGATAAENQWVIDGVNTTNVFQGTQGKVLSSEFVQEVEVKTGGYQAEYGRALGGVINVITKSGGNQFHGDGFVYYDSTDTAAERQFRPGDSGITRMRVADGQRFDYGFDLGGYFVKDRLWFFGAYNRIALSSELSRAQPAAHVSTSDRFPLDATDNIYSGKLTWNAARSTTVVGNVFADPHESSGAAGADPSQGFAGLKARPPLSLDPSTWYSSRTQGGTDYALRLTQLFGTGTIATIQGSYHRDRNTLSAANTIRYTDLTCEGGTPDHPCELPPEANNVTGGYGLVSGIADNGESHRGQVAASAIFYAANHELKAGGDYWNGETEAENYRTGGQTVTILNERGVLYYEHVFYGTNRQDPIIVPSWKYGAQVLDYGFYVQDSWRVASNVTVNAGLRWDGEDTRDQFGVSVMRFDKEWQPRVGVVWDPWNDGATKVHAFAGRFSYALPTADAAISFGYQPGQYRTYNLDPVLVAPDPKVIGRLRTRTPPGSPFGTPVDEGVRASSQDELTVGIERLLLPTLTIGLKGTYRSLVRALEQRADLDYNDDPRAMGSQFAIINPGSDGAFASGEVQTCNGYFGDAYACGLIGMRTPDAKRYYRGIELLARQTVGTSLWLQASYVYSTLRGNYDGAVNEANYGQTAPGANTDFDYPSLWHNAYGELYLDRTHRFRFDGYWISPWRVSIGVQTFAETGAPLNRTGYFNENFASSVYLVPRGSAGRLPTLWDANLTLGYSAPIGPVTATLQAYVFSVFNKQIATGRDEAWGIFPPPADYPASMYDPNQPQNNPNYGTVTQRAAPRVFRAALKISF